MDQRKYNNHPWDDRIYGTGRTQPRKNHGGLIAFLLILVILLSGIVGILGTMNIKLFAQLKAQKLEDNAMTFSDQGQTASYFLDPSESTDSIEAHASDSASIDLQPTPESAENYAEEDALSWQEIYDRNIVSVVSILCDNSTGTGVVLTADGYIITNSHVVEDAGTVRVRLTDGEEYPAMIIGSDAVSDLAVLYIECNGLTPATFGNSDSLRVGDAVAAIGDPMGVQFHGTMTDGIVSAINRNVTVSGRTMTLIQTNAALNSGNSGGPLINCYGQVIGINTMKISAFAASSGVEGLGFAIPSTTVKEISEQLIRQGYVSGRPDIGLEGESVSSFYQYYYHMPSGLYITHVDTGSDAHEKGIEYGDILISINNQRITDMDSLNTVLYAHDAGDTVNVVIYRSGKQYSLTLTLHENKG
jgi:serine protease Do